jgi:alpha,alpha-trehalase
MGQMYIGAREAYPDGMTLACANPREGYDYEGLKVLYVQERERLGDRFSDVTFFNQHFETVPPDKGLYLAPPGQTLDEYTLAIRPKFIYPNTKQSHFGIWLPHDRSVAGIGRFGEHSFLWDGYHMAKGYHADGRWDLVLNVTDNTEYEINRFGHPLNGSAEFYATRPQPDYFAHEVRMLADTYGSKALVRYLSAMEKNHMGYWMDGMEELAALPDDGKAHAHRALVRMPDGSFLNRYWDDDEGPRLESFKEDVELADKCIKEEEIALGGLTAVAQKARRQKFYKDQRAGATTGWDYSSRWFKDGRNPHTINTTDIIPVDLNSLMAYNEETLAMAWDAAAQEGGYEDPETQQVYTLEECLERSTMYREMFTSRSASIKTHNWDPVAKIYRDHNFVERYQTGIVSAAMVYPLYVGISNKEQTLSVADAVEKDLLYEGGIIATTTEDCNTQWDGGKREGGTRSKNVWAPFNWAAVRGFGRMAHKLYKMQVEKPDIGPEWKLSEAEHERLLVLAEKGKAAYMHGVEVVFETHRVVTEKHRGDDPATLADGGEYALVKLLAMSGETWRAMKNLDPRDAADHLSMGNLALAF